MGCEAPRVGHCDARMPRSVRYVRTRPVLLQSPRVDGRIFVRTAGGCADFLSGAALHFPPEPAAAWKAAHPMCFPGSVSRSPSANACQQHNTPPASGTHPPTAYGTRRRGICLFCRMPRLTAGPYPGWRCCRCRGPQIPRCNRPYGRRAPRNCRWRRADSPCRAGPAPRPGSRRRRCPRNP